MLATSDFLRRRLGTWEIKEGSNIPILGEIGESQKSFSISFPRSPLIWIKQKPANGVSGSVKHGTISGLSLCQPFGLYGMGTPVGAQREGILLLASTCVSAFPCELSTERALRSIGESPRWSAAQGCFQPFKYLRASGPARAGFGATSQPSHRRGDLGPL
jgi:hypothetical protein